MVVFCWAVPVSSFFLLLQFVFFLSSSSVFQFYTILSIAHNRHENGFINSFHCFCSPLVDPYHVETLIEQVEKLLQKRDKLETSVRTMSSEKTALEFDILTLLSQQLETLCYIISNHKTYQAEYDTLVIASLDAFCQVSS